MMCGICGFVGFEDKKLLERMKDAIRHRGPDGHGSFIDKNISLGAVRLAIIDLSKAGNQPIHNEDESLWIIFNGEIYNFKEIRPQLEKEGHKFYSNTDTEVILHSYEQYGLDFIHYLNGMFAFAIWDSKKKKLILARDRIGVKPLYYTFTDGKFIFASEIKAILEAEFIKREVNLNALYDYLTFINIPSPYTLFKNIYKVPAGHMLILDTKSMKLKIKKYWDIANYKIDKNITEEEAIKKTRKLLENSIKLRMISDVPIGVFLSGGIDSTTITALMNKISEEPIRTFTIATGEEERYNELKWGEFVSEYYGTDHTEITINDEDVIKFLPKLIHYEDEPIGDPVNIPVYYLAKTARKKGVIVLKVGEGGDELFCGYPFYKLELTAYKLFNLTKFFPGFRSIVFTAARLFWKMKGRDVSFLLKDQFERVKKGGDFPWHNLLGFTELEKKNIISSEMANKVNKSSYDFIKDICKQIPHNNSDWFLFKERVIEFKNRLPELLLMRVDKFTMATSVEAREPLLDYKLVEFEMSVPPSLHLKNGEHKYVFKKAVKYKIPKEILKRKKIGFGVPIADTLAKSMKDFALQQLSNPELKKFINLEYAKKLIEEHRKNLADTSFRVWILLNFALWYKYWIEREKIKI